ncbi:MAG: NPCBM/NEW2 domain-containing protein [Fimbriimonadaceae bacterium]
MKLNRFLSIVTISGSVLAAAPTALERSVLVPLANSETALVQEDGWPKRVAGQGLYGDLKTKHSVAGQIFTGHVTGQKRYIVRADFVDGVFDHGVYDLGKGYSRFSGSLGLPDDYPTSDEGTFRFQIDGETVLEGKVRKGAKVTPIELDLTGADSIRIDLDFTHIFEPRFVRSDTPDSKKVSLVSPGNGAKVKRGNVMLTWKPIEEAVAYGIHLTATKLDDAQSDGSQRMWAFTTGEQPVFNLEGKDMPTGEYRWTVIAFDQKRTLGVVSDFRRLIITK